MRAASTAAFLLIALSILTLCPQQSCAESSDSASDARFRVIVSSDIGGTDPDDFQSMVHLLVCADSLDLEGIISSPYGQGRKADILTVIDHYATDYPNLQTYSQHYPTPDALRALAKQGEVEMAPYAGYRQATEGSNWIIQRACADDPRPLYVLVWGGLEDLVQALHDAPDILPKLRVYWIGGPNKKWSANAYQYLVTHFPQLWFIEANDTYRGWFTGGNQSGDWDNTTFVTKHIADRGALGRFFATQLGGTIKMGDSPSVTWLLLGKPATPDQPSWGGQFVRAWPRPYQQLNRLPNREDRLDKFGILEMEIPYSGALPENPTAVVTVADQQFAAGQQFVGEFHPDGKYRIRFSPKAAGRYTFTVNSNVPSLPGQTGELTAVQPAPELKHRPDPNFANWWTDDPSPAVAEVDRLGTKTVSRWREQFLRDFAVRMSRCEVAKDTGQ